ncbi:GNAT family N-acetyltransferase [Streptomyces sp. NPDC001586]|uniref:GNAT family N-acetyltransferase n=1 Tax=Streptomyces sp. NPDC001586 TaxID=3154387 RepID=UPI00332FBBBC
MDSVRAAESWIADRGGHWAEGSAFAFAVVEGDGTVLGNVSVGAVDRRQATGWVSYWTTAAARGRGVTSAACRSLSHARLATDPLR